MNVSPKHFRSQRRAAKSLNPRRKAALFATFSMAVLFSGRSAWAVTDTEKDVLGTATDLGAAASYSGGTLPNNTNDVTFTAGTTYTNASTLNFSTSQSFATLNDLNATAFTISDTSAAATLTLGAGGFSNAVASANGGATTDLIYVASGGNLSIQPGTKVLSIALAASGNLDVGSGGTLSIGSAMSGAVSLTKTGSGALTLSGANTYTGTTSITGGTVNVGVSSVANNVGVANFVGVSGAFGQNGDVTLSGGSTLNLNNFSLQLDSLATVAGTSVTLGTGTLTIAGNASTAIAGTVTGTGTVVKNGTGTLTLSGTNTGNMTLNTGVLRGVGATTTFGTGTLTLNGGELQVANSTGYSYGNSTTVAGSATITPDTLGGTTGVTNAFGALTVNGNLIVNGGSSVTSGTQGLTFSSTALGGTSFFAVNNPTAAGSTATTALTLGALSGTSSFIKQGAGTLVVTGAGTRSAGSSYITNGTLVIGGTGTGAADGLGTAAAALQLFGGTTLDLAAGTTTATGVAAHPTTVFGSTTILADASASTTGFTQTLGALTVLGADTLTINKGANITGTAANVAFGATTTNAATTFSVGTGANLTLSSTLGNGGFTTTFNGAGTSTVAGIIGGGGGLTMSGSGTLTLAAANTYTGVTNISGGTVTLGNLTGLGAAGTAVLNMTGGTLNTATFSPTLLALTGSSSSTISSTGANTLTITPVANSTSSFAGTIGGGGGTLGVTVNGTGALSLSGNNTYSGTTTLTAGQLNVNASGTGTTNSAIGTGAFTLNGGIIDNTSGGTVTLATNNAVTVGGNFTYGGTQSLNLGAGTTSLAVGRTISLLGSGSKTLTIQNLSNTAAGVVETFVNLPGSNSTASIGNFNNQTTGTASAANGISGNANVAITGGINPTVTAAGFTYANIGSLTLTGTSTYTGLLNVNAGNFTVDNSAGATTLAAASTLGLGGGNFIYKGAAAGSNQTLGVATLGVGYSSIQVVGGTSGTSTLALGTLTDGTNNSLLNINLSGTGSAVTTSTANTNNLFGTRGAVTVTTGGTTEFATKNASNQLVQYTGQTAFVNTGSVSTTNYALSGSSQLAAIESMNSLRLTTSGTASSLDLNGKALTLTSGGLLYVGGDAYEIKDVAGGGSLKSNTATASDLIIHNFGTGGLTISAVIANGVGTSVLSLDGTGTTYLRGANTYTGATLAGGGAVLNIDSNARLGAGAATITLTLNNATLQAGASFTNTRNIVLGASGGTFDTQGNTLTDTGTITGTGSLTKVGTGTLLLNTGANTYSGGFTNVQNGTLQIGSTGSITTTTDVVLGNGITSGILQLGDSTGTKTQVAAGLFTSGTGTGNAVVGGSSAGNSTLTFTGTVATPSVFGGSLGSSTITNGNNLALSITAGALTLNGASTFTGGTTLAGASVLNLGNAAALGGGGLSVTTATAVIDNTSGGLLTLNNNNLTTGVGFVFGGSNNLNFGSSALLNISAATSTIAVDGSSTLTFGGGLVNTTALSQTAITVNGSTGTLSLGGFLMQTGGTASTPITETLLGSGNINITGAINPGAVNANNNLSYTGTGVLTISGAGNYTGTTTVNNAGGILRFGAGGSLNSASNLTLSAGTVDVGGQAISVATFTPTAGLVTSSAAGGSLVSTGLATGAANFSGTLSLDLTGGAAAATLSGNFLNTGTIKLTDTGAAAITLSGNVLSTGNISLVNNSTVASGSTALGVSGILFNPTGTLAVSGTSASNTAISSVIGSNVTSLTNSSGNLSLTGANVYSGGTFINGGVVTIGLNSQVADSRAIYAGPLGTGTVTLAGGTLTGDATATRTIANNVSIMASSTLGGGTGLTLDGTGLATPATVSLDVASPVLKINGPVSIFDVISNGTAGTGYTKAGTGTLTVTAANTYTGPTTISAGTLTTGTAVTFGNAGTGGTPGIFGASSNAAANLVFDGGTLYSNYNLAPTSTDRLFTLTANGGTIDSSASTSTNTLSFTNAGAVVDAGTGARTLNLIGTNLGGSTFAPSLADQSVANPTSLVKNGAGYWLLSNAGSTFSGGTTITLGALNATAAGALGTGPVTVAAGATGLILSGAGTYTNAVTIGASSGQYTAGNTGTALEALALTNGANLSGALTLNGGAGTLVRIGGTNSTGTISGVISGNASPDFNTVATNVSETLTLTNTGNNYTGNTYIEYNGTSNAANFNLTLGNSGVIPHGALAGNVVMNTVYSAGQAILSLNSYSQTVNGLSSGGGGGLLNNNTATSADIAVQNGSATAGTSTLTVGDNNASGNFLGTLRNGGTGLLALAKVGSGTQTLGGISSTVTTGTNPLLVTGLTGGITVTQGSLVEDLGSVSASGGTAPPLAVTNYLPTAAASGVAALTLNGGTFSELGRANQSAQTFATTNFTSRNNGTVVSATQAASISAGQLVTINGVSSVTVNSVTTVYYVAYVDRVNNIVYFSSNASISATQGASNTYAFQALTNSTSSQTLPGVTVAGGNSGINVNDNGSGATVLNLGAITRNVGATVDFTLPGTASATEGVTTATTSNSVGVLTSTAGTAYATVAGTNWAGNTQAAGSLYSITPVTSVADNYNAANTDVVTSGTQGAFTTNTLRFNTPGTNLDLGGASTVSTGGILVTSATKTNGVSITSTGGTGSLQAGAGNELVIINNGTLAVSAPIVDGAAGNSALTISGAGTTTITGANTYSGPTTINGGTYTPSTPYTPTNNGGIPALMQTVYVNNTSGNGLGTGTLVVNNNGTLAGNGTLSNSATTINGGGTVSPGASSGAIGVLTLSNSVTFTGTAGSLSTLSINLSGTANSMLQISGALNLSTTGDEVTILGMPASGTNTYTLVTAMGGVTGTFDNSVLPSGYSLTYDANDVFLTNAVVATPEPATWAAGALTVLAGGCMVRRRLRTMKPVVI